MKKPSKSRLQVTVTYLEMTDPPTRPPMRPPLAQQPLALMRVHEPTLSYYRYLYNTVGEPWLWYERRQLGDEPLADIIADERVAIYVLLYGAVPAGFAELDSRPKGVERRGDVHLAYFGLVPDFIGRSFGRYFLEAIIDIAWERNPEGRLTVHTCTLDHPAALPLYQRCGFAPTGQRTASIIDPRTTGVLPADAGPPSP